MLHPLRGSLIVESIFRYLSRIVTILGLVDYHREIRISHSNPRRDRRSVHTEGIGHALLNYPLLSQGDSALSLRVANDAVVELHRAKNNA
jgi:hypothetical protein